LCTLPVYLEGRLTLFIKFHLLIKKKDFVVY